MGQLALILIAVLTFSASTSNAEDSARAPNVDGYVTRVVSAQDFDVSFVRVLPLPNARYLVGDLTVPHANVPYKPYVGQQVKIFGDLDKKHHTITTAEMRFIVPSFDDSVSGIAIIDLIPKQDHSNPKQLLVRADGYLIFITPDTVFRSDLPNQSIAAIHTNMWIAYHGHHQLNGTVLADKASFFDNKIIPDESKVLARTEYDPEKVDPDAFQNDLSKSFLGLDPKRIPPYKDQAMQARINRIGFSLVPAYQRALPDSDPTKINFRFQLVDQHTWPDAMTWPSGVILVPYQIVDRLQDDSELATVLADNIANVLEKQSLRLKPTLQNLAIAGIAADVGGFFVPGLSLVAIGTSGTAAVERRHARQQSGRVSISLLSDAGYDIHQAPLAWWLLASKKPKDPADISIPYRTAYLYQTIAATTDHTQAKP